MRRVYAVNIITNLNLVKKYEEQRAKFQNAGKMCKLGLGFMEFSCQTTQASQEMALT